MSCVDIEDQDHVCTYNVYSLWDGVVDNERSFCDYGAALMYYRGLITATRALIKAEQPDIAEVTVHLYDTFNGNMIRECVIEV